MRLNDRIAIVTGAARGIGLAIAERLAQEGAKVTISDVLDQDGEAAAKAIYSGLSPNEVRKRYHDIGPVKGGDAVYMQQQNFSIEALAKRDAMDDPFARATAKVDATAVGGLEVAGLVAEHVGDVAVGTHKRVEAGDHVGELVGDDAIGVGLDVAAGERGRAPGRVDGGDLDTPGLERLRHAPPSRRVDRRGQLAGVLDDD